ncbi:alpha/beta fold hydrolase [Salinicola salarius]|uniref:alpha/beta fold hydrolase n=1 Tax=Salinicola salarius TaxID=430457 RepID=UPI00350E5568
MALHGWLDNAATFSRLAPALATALGIRLVALDLPGHGHSPHRGVRAEYPLWGYMPDVLEAVDALKLNSATFVGHSMGAGVASLIAAAAPERVDGLVLIDGLASTTSVPRLKPLMMRLRRGNCAGCGPASGHSSDTSAPPLSTIASASLRWRRG